MAIDTTYRFPQFGIGDSVGELQGELQHPPESLRRGRKCLLLGWPITDESVYDHTAARFIEYLEARKVEHYLFGDDFSLLVGDSDEVVDAALAEAD